MTQRSRTTLKTYFNTGDKPTEAQFSDFIDSGFNYEDKDYSEWRKVNIQYTDLLTAGLTIDIPIDTHDAKEYFVEIWYHLITKPTGGAISGISIQLYEDTLTYALSGPKTLNTVGNSWHTHRLPMESYFVCNMDASWDSILHFIATGANLDQLTAGELDVYYRVALVNV
jgi:hypothetical protein